MPQVRAAVVRSAPASTIANARIRRAAAASFSRHATERRASAVKSSRVMHTAADIDPLLYPEQASSQTFIDSGIPESQISRPLV